jgi:predicted transcriptional regulator
VKDRDDVSFDARPGDQLLGVLSALASPHRLRIVGVLQTGGRQYVSQLAREIGMSRPLLIMHLQRLEAVGLVNSNLELSDDGKAMKYYEVTPFALQLTPALIAEAARSLEAVAEGAAGTSEEEDGTQ